MNSDDKLPLSAFMPNHLSLDPHAPFIATAGKKNNSSTRFIDKSEIVERLKTIHDPELPVNIYELGLIYDIQIKDEKLVSIKMTLTTPNCPVAESLPKEVKDSVMQVEGIEDVDLQLVWEPPWNKDMMSEAAKLEMNL